MKITGFIIKSILLIIFSLYGSIQAQSPLVQNVYNRNTTSLNGNWHYIIDPYENGYYNYRYEPFDQQENPSKSAFFMNGKQENPSELLEYNFDEMPILQVPGDWNSQKVELQYYEGTVWYKRSFDFKKSADTSRVFIYFEGVNYKAEVYLNGKKLGSHVGGFTPFQFEITDYLEEAENFVVVKVDNKRLKEGVPTLNTDWWNFGGITRDVKLIETPSTFIQDYFIHLNPKDSTALQGYIKLDGEEFKKRYIKLSIPELDFKEGLRTNKEGIANFEYTIRNFEKWSTDNPKLYDVHIKFDEDSLMDKVGFRTIQTKDDQIVLNGKPIYLKGISIHEENPIRGGRAYSKEDAAQLLDWAQELGCNYVRLAHYPHNEHMVRLADERGILVWEENPVYWTIDWENEATYQNAKNQLSEVITRDKNRASVIIWSMANETPNVPARNIFLEKLAYFTRDVDPTRLISAALEQTNYRGNPKIRTIDDPFAEFVDVLSFNQYIGWYDGLPEKANDITWKFSQNKPVVISEFGAGAKFGYHDDKSVRWTEEYQEDLYIKTLTMLSKVRQIRGISPWILVDFRSPRRVLPKIQDGWNRKGLISDKGEKKKAFYILQKYYQAN